MNSAQITTSLAVSEAKSSTPAYSVAYQTVENEFGIDLAAQTQINLERLKQELTDRTYVPQEEAKSYGDEMLSREEKALFTTWQEKIVPLFTLKHATPRITFDALTPIAMREREGRAANFMNVFSNFSGREFSFFVLGIGSAHRTPAFVSDDADVITVNLAEATKSFSDIAGLWIGGHLVDYDASRPQPPIHFDNTTRQFCFDGAAMTKAYTYQRAQGQCIQVVRHYQDEIFAATTSLDTIFTALFYQFILELRLIGGEFQRHILQNANAINVITQAYHLLFKSSIYPEVKLPTKLHLNKPYVSVSHVPGTLQAKWFRAAENLNLQTLNDCVEQAKQQGLDIINSVNKHHETAFFLAMKSSRLKEPVVRYLLGEGADITIADSMDRTVLHLAIEHNDQNVFELAEGIKFPFLPHAKAAFDMRKPLWVTLALTAGDFELASYFLTFNPIFSADCCVIVDAYLNKADTDYITQLIDREANVNAPDLKGMTALMYAAKQGDDEGVSFLIEQGANINLAIETTRFDVSENEGKTALYFAVEHGHLNVVKVLLAAGANINHEDYFGSNVYFQAKKIAALLENPETKFSPVDDKYKALFETDIFSQPKRNEKIALRKNLIEIIHFLEESKAETEIKIKSARQTCFYRKQCAVVMVTGKINNEPVVVFGRKMNNYSLQPQGFYLLPGGLKDQKDADFAQTAYRELFEETGLKLNSYPVKKVHTYAQLEGEGAQAVFTEIHFFHIDIGQVPLHFKFSARDDLINLEWVKWSNIQKINNDNGVCYQHKDIRINPSNALLVESVLNQVPLINEQVDQAISLDSHHKAFEMIAYIYANDITSLKKMCEQGADADKANALFYACMLGKIEFVDVLIKAGGNINAIVSYRDLKIAYKPLAILLEFNFGIGRYDQHLTPLIVCVALGRFDMAKTLVEKYHARVDIAPRAYSVLYYACLHNNKDFIDYLLQSKRQELVVEGGAIMNLLRNGNYPLADRFFKQKICDINQRFYQSATNIHFLEASLLSYCSDFAKFFLEQGAPIYFITENKQSFFEQLGLLLDLNTYSAEYAESLRNSSDPESLFSIISAFNGQAAIQNMLAQEESRKQRFPEIYKIAQLVIAKAEAEPSPDLFFQSVLIKLKAKVNSFQQATEATAEAEQTYKSSLKFG